jgi:NodT family efflux transporter outer membrane factor (OMF) lipoprotein
MIRQFRTAALTASLASILAGCMVGPDYVRPADRLQPFRNNAARVPTATPAPQPDSWWAGFNDPQLTTVIQRALDQNLDLMAAIARVSQARAAARGARARLLPTVDAQASATTQRLSAVSPLGSIAGAFPDQSLNQEDYQAGGLASWELDLAGGLRRGAAAARSEFAAVDADRIGTRISVAADAADAYLQVRGLQARLAAAGQQVAIDERLLDLVRFRQANGAADGREVVQVEALLRQARANLPLLRIGLEAQLNRLDVLMGAQPGTYAQELSAVAPIPAIPPVGAAEPVEVLRRRPDVIAAERRLAAANERIGVAISDYYPKISLSGALGFESMGAGNLFTSRAFQPVGTGLIRWRLFDFGKVDAQVGQARGAYAEQLALYRRSILLAAEDVENALVSLTQNQGRMVELEAAAAALERSRALSEQAYKGGSSPLTDVLEANRQLLIARDQLNDTRAAAARSAVHVFRALGGGWDPATTSMPSLGGMRAR